MNEFIKKMFAAGVCLCGIGLVLLGIGVIRGGRQYAGVADLNRMSGTAMKDSGNGTAVKDSGNGTAVEDSNGSVQKLEKTQIEDVEKLDITLGVADLYIKPSQDAQYYLEYCFQNSELKRGEKEPVSYQVTDGVLTMKDHLKSTYTKVDINFLGRIFGGDEAAAENAITLYVPETNQTVGGSIQSDCGDISIRGLHVNTLNIKSKDGDMDIKNTSWAQGKITCDTGDVAFKNTELQNFQVVSDTGDVEAEKISVKDTVSVKTDCGDVDVKLQKEPGKALNIQAKTDDGSLSADKSLDGSKSGSDGEVSYRRTVNQTAGLLDITTDTGDISIK